MLLEDRTVLRVSGADRASFLQGLLSADIRRCTLQRALWAAFLTPQGRYLHDVFVLEREGAFWLDCEAGARGADLETRLRRYVLRAAVRLEAVPDLRVYAIAPRSLALGSVESTPGAVVEIPGGALFVDPRHPELGERLIAPLAQGADFLAAQGLRSAARSSYDRRRLALGVPDGSRDLTPDAAFPLENGFDELGGIDWEKGCYVGQEVTARVRYRGLVKKRLLPARLTLPPSAAPPATGTPILAAETEIGVVRSVCGLQALALLRLAPWRSALEAGVPLRAGEALLTAAAASWMRLP